MENIIPLFLSFNSFSLYLRKIRARLNLPITFVPSQKTRGTVLLSYVTHPFTITKTDLCASPHTNPWECIGMVDLLLARGFTVDVIDWKNHVYVPTKPYVMVIDIHSNLERLSPLLPPECVKVFYSTGAYWKYHNEAEQRRVDEVSVRRGFSLVRRRVVLPENAIQVADYVTTLGSEFAKDTYKDSGKKITRIPLLLPTTYPSPLDKEYDAVRKSYVFIGGGGAIHKGLDRVLECFASLPDFSLTVCGPFEHETDFVDAYRKELYETPNITFVGRIDIRGEQFKDIAAHSLGLVYPSCSEGQSGSVITALHAGLIPIVTYESGVDVEPFGIMLPDASVESIRDAVTSLSGLSADDLATRTELTWKEARKSHTYHSFLTSYGSFIDSILTERKV